MASLRSLLNSPVRLHFKDGEIVEAELLGVDELRDRDITYEIRKIVAPPPPPRASDVGTTYVASLDELAHWEEIGRHAT